LFIFANFYHGGRLHVIMVFTIDPRVHRVGDAIIRLVIFFLLYIVHIFKADMLLLPVLGRPALIILIRPRMETIAQPICSLTRPLMKALMGRFSLLTRPSPKDLVQPKEADSLFVTCCIRLQSNYLANVFHIYLIIDDLYYRTVDDTLLRCVAPKPGPGGRTQ
jgi:hypothetical protein